MEYMIPVGVSTIGKEPVLTHSGGRGPLKPQAENTAWCEYIDSPRICGNPDHGCGYVIFSPTHRIMSHYTLKAAVTTSHIAADQKAEESGYAVVDNVTVTGIIGWPEASTAEKFKNLLTFAALISGIAWLVSGDMSGILLLLAAAAAYAPSYAVKVYRSRIDLDEIARRYDVPVLDAATTADHKGTRTA